MYSSTLTFCFKNILILSKLVTLPLNCCGAIGMMGWCLGSNFCFKLLSHCFKYQFSSNFFTVGCKTFMKSQGWYCNFGKNRVFFEQMAKFRGTFCNLASPSRKKFFCFTLFKVTSTTNFFFFSNICRFRRTWKLWTWSHC